MAFPDKLYDKSRDELLPYEDSEFAQLIANVPNFYISLTDQTIWGSLLRDVAAELGRLEYAHAYDIVGKDPAYLTPPDAKRQWNDPLFINKNYPQNDQFDLDYKALVTGLIRAFQKGATVQSIQEVIKAYTGQDIVIEEQWTRIKDGYYDASVRNMLRMSVKIGGASVVSLDGSDVNTTLTTISKLKTITDDLYGAIDMAKPAHVGLNLTTVFGLDEHISELVDGIDDTLRIIAIMQEAEPLPPPLTLAPYFDSDSPDTGLASTAPENPLHKVFVPASTNPAPPPANPAVGYTLAEFAAIQSSANKGAVSLAGVPAPRPGVLSPTLNIVWEISDDSLDIMDVD